MNKWTFKNVYKYWPEKRAANPDSVPGAHEEQFPTEREQTLNSPLNQVVFGIQEPHAAIDTFEGHATQVIKKKKTFWKQLELCTSTTSIMQKKKVAAALTPHTGTENV